MYPYVQSSIFGGEGAARETENLKYNLFLDILTYY